MLVKIAICDDEQDSLDDVKSKINKYSNITKETIQIHMFQDINSFLLECGNYDVIFLDIFLGDINGFDIMEKIMYQNTDAKIIIISNHSEFHRTALSSHSFDYLNKPIEYDQLAKTLTDVIRLLELQNKKEAHFEFINRNICIRVKYSEIYYFEYINKCLKLQTASNEYLIRAALKDIKKDLDQRYFIFPHQSFIVNPRFILSIKNLEIKMSNGKIIPVSQLQRIKVKEDFKKYTFSK